jgi:hypothetical protein
MKLFEGVRLLAGVGALMAVTASALAPAASAQAGTVGLTIHAHPSRLRKGRSLSVEGRLSGPAGPLAGALVELQQAPLRGGRFRDIAHATTRGGGVYRFARLRPEASMRYRVRPVSVSGSASRAVTITVEIPLVEFPHSGGVIAAAHYLSRRAGTTAFAVYDNEHKLSGLNVHLRFHTASVVKSMLLVAYLQTLAAERRGLDPESTGLLYPMIHSSDNNAASAIFAIVGESGVERVARESHMQDFSPSAAWGFTEVSASDLARFFYIQDTLIPRRFDGYARWLFSHIEPSESWGVPAAGQPAGFEVFFKGGWLPESEGLVNQGARLERGRDTFGMAVLTREDPSMGYGEETLEGVASRLVHGG